MTKTIRLAEVAEAAGVSRGTASNVFNKPELVRDALRERVHEAARVLGYAGPSPKGRLLRSGKTNAIGIAAAEPLEYFFADPWARQLLTEVANVCDARGAGLALISVAHGGRLDWSIENALVDGFLLRCAGRELIVEVAQKRGLPFVALSLDTAAPDVPAIDIDDFGGAQDAARHLTALGHRRVAVLGIGLGNTPGRIHRDQVLATHFVNVRERAKGYWAALAEMGVPDSDVPVYAVQDDGGNMGEVLAPVFATTEPPTALLAMSDRIALRALDWLARQGLRVPTDVSVVGFDDVPSAARASPALTTVAQPYRRVAERAVAAILDGSMPDGREVLPLTLVIRDSTGLVPDRQDSKHSRISS
jgi:DNA-binding LacI/PurR family transcriptional regulator